jgi:NitT/TauT family transport system substrate-binding protein
LVGEKRFPERETGLIAQIVGRDLPYYDAAISDTSIAGVVAFGRDLGLLDRDVAHGDIVATQFSHLWGAA